MIENPFTSKTFSSIWAKHFSPSLESKKFGFLTNLVFAKHKYLPLYLNFGKTHTKGISYSIENDNVDEIKGKILLIYDVPLFFNIPDLSNSRIKRYRTKQYPGFLINLEPYSDLNAYMAGTFKKSSRYKLNKYKRKLESCFDIRYKMFRGEMDRDEYVFIFNRFNQLLTKRFDDKQITNNNLDKAEWDFYFEVAYPMLIEGKAGLFVIYNEDQPIGVTLCYFSDEIVFDAITVFDIDYAKFHLGSATIMKLVEWSIEHDYKIFDFSKGYFDYKKRWASKEYNFEYHVLYDAQSIMAKTLAFGIKSFFDFKQFLRDKHVNDKLHELTYKLKNKSNNIEPITKLEFSEPDRVYNKEELTELNYKSAGNQQIKNICFEFLYLNNESQKDLKIFKINDKDNQFLIFGKEITVLAKA